MGVIQQLNYKLNNYPRIKRHLKRVYQRVNYSISSKKRVEGSVIKVSPDDNDSEYFFGYYDKSPWDATGRYMLCLRAKDTRREVSPKEPAEIILIDTQRDKNDTDRIKVLGKSNSWNVQQGCMLQWLGPDFETRIIYNDFRNGRYVAVILDILDGNEREIDFPVYSVDPKGNFALSLDFSRLFNLRPGYGYYNLREETEGIGLPETPAIWRIDLNTGNTEGLLSYSDLINLNPREGFADTGAVHKVNHIMISPDGDRFMFLHRWFYKGHKYSRLISCDIDGKNMKALLDEDMVSHCCWKDNSTIVSYARSVFGIGYVCIDVDSGSCEQIWTELKNDGHPGFSPDGKRAVTDTYADKKRMCAVIVIEDGKPEVKARLFEPFSYDNDTRCDLHPRWDRDGRQICIDAAFEGRRGLYIVT